MIYTLSDLQAGRVAVVNDGTVEQLNKVLQAAWPGCDYAFGSSVFYCKNDKRTDDGGAYWMAYSHASSRLPTQSVSLFSLREEPQERELWIEVLDHIGGEATIEWLAKNYLISKK